MQAWENFLTTQEQELGKETVEKWLRPLQVLRFDACNLYLEAKDSFQALWFEEHLRRKLEMAFFNNNKKPIKVHLSVKNREEKKEKSVAPKEEDVQKHSLTPYSIQFEQLDPHTNFSSFISEENNLLAYRLLQESCETKEPTFNPIFIHGKSGSGKSHLLMATAKALEAKGLKVLYSRAETFTENVVRAIRAGEMRTFRKAYRNVEVLLVDDIHTLSKKSATQEEFFHTFNTLHLEGKQIILSSLQAPQELKSIEARLISRFEWGIVLPLSSLSKEGIVTLLDEKAAVLGLELESSVKDYLLQTFSSSPKSLVRALSAIALRSALSKQSEALSIENIRHMLFDLIEEEKQCSLTAEKILQCVAQFYGIRSHDILSKSHAREYTLPRQVSMFLCRSHLSMPYMKIGEIFSRDHSTVMNSVKQIQKNLDHNEKEITSSIHSISGKLQVKN